MYVCNNKQVFYKMKKTALVSKVLYMITRVLAWLYLITGLYGAFSWISKTNIQIQDHQTIINFPFTDSPFLILDSNTTYLVFAFLLPVFSYALFFWLLSKVFKVFFQNKLFTLENIGQLKRFYLANLFLPALLITFSSFFIEIENEMYLISVLHLFLGIFIFIISEIFNQGLTLQNEQDLYI